MVLISSGNSEISAHRWNDLCILICLRRLSQEQSQICFFFCKKSVFLYTCATCSQLLSNTSTMDTPNYTSPASFDIIGLSLAINTFTSAGLVFIAPPPLVVGHAAKQKYYQLSSWLGNIWKHQQPIRPLPFTRDYPMSQNINMALSFLYYILHYVIQILNWSYIKISCLGNTWKRQ